MKTVEQVKMYMERRSLIELIDAYGTYSYMVGAMTQTCCESSAKRLERDIEIKDYIEFLINERLGGKRS